MAVAPASCLFVATLVVHPELCFDRLVPFLPVADLKSVCESLQWNRAGHALITNTAQWRYAIARDGLGGSSVAFTRTVKCASGCPELTDYLSLRSQLESFDANVVVLAGDLEKINNVDGISVDCLVFPTSSSFRNPVIGVAGCVHRRIGAPLREYLSNHRPTVISRTERILTTPGFVDGIELLVHCVGPSGMARDRRVLLYDTYLTALSKVEATHNVKCAAIASISTGTLRYPVDEAAEVAMAALQELMRTRLWPSEKKIAFVCVDNAVLKAFTEAREATKHAFFTSGPVFPDQIQAIPAP